MTINKFKIDSNCIKIFPVNPTNKKYKKRYKLIAIKTSTNKTIKILYGVFRFETRSIIFFTEYSWFG